MIIKKLLPFCLLLLAGIAGAQSIQFSADITQANGQATPTLTWATTPVANTCDATGAWLGAKGPSGVEIQPTITSNATYNLTCTWPAGAVTLTWTAPTQNEDGTPLTDLTSYNIYQGVVSGTYPTIIPLLDAAATSYLVVGLIPGTYYFAATAINSQGVESVLSNEAVKIVTLTNATQAVGITINPQPKPPTGFGAQ